MRNLTSLLISCGVAVAMVSSLAAQTVQGHATVVRVKGAARCSHDGNWKDLKVGDILQPGTVVQTGLDKGSYVDLVLSESGGKASLSGLGTGVSSSSSNDSAAAAGYKAQAQQNVVRVNENTALGIDKLTAQNTGASVVTDTQLDLKQGRITGNVKKLTPGSKYEIKIPNGVAGIRGTLYDLTAEGVLRVRVGQVVLATVGPDGQPITQSVNANEQYDARSRQITPLSAGAIQSFEPFGSQVRAATPAAMEDNEIYLDQTVRRVSPSKGKSKGKGKADPFF